LNLVSLIRIHKGNHNEGQLIHHMDGLVEIASVSETLHVGSVFLDEFRVIKPISIFSKDINTNYYLSDQVSSNQHASDLVIYCKFFSVD
jgi:hypothetical protein